MDTIAKKNGKIASQSKKNAQAAKPLGASGARKKSSGSELSSVAAAGGAIKIMAVKKTRPARVSRAAPLEIKQHRPKKFYSIYNIGLRESKDSLLENLALLLSAGMDLIASLEAVKSEAGSWRMRRLIEVLQEEINNGQPFWLALAGTKAFSSQAQSLIKIGEESGRLVENLKVVVLQQQKERQFSSKLSSAMIYPGFIMIVTISVGLGIAWFVLPNLARVFASLNVELPLITRLLIDAGLFVNQYGSIVIPLSIAGLIFLAYIIFFFKPTKVLGQFIARHTLGIKKLILQTEVARFGFVLGTLLSAGMPLLSALQSMSDATEYRVYRKFYKFMAVEVEAGNSFKKCFDAYRGVNQLIPKSIQQLIVAGERSGNLSDTLIKIGEIFEEKIEMTTKNLSILLEPILLFIVWLGVLAVAIAVILPIYSLVGNFNPS